MNNLKNKLAIEKKDKASLQEEFEKEKDFQKEYKHNIEIQRKQKTKNEHKIKTLILIIEEDNEELKEKIGLMKFQIQELKQLRKMVKVWETIKRKWTKKLFIYKQQKEALNNQVEALTRGKKRECTN